MDASEIPGTGVKLCKICRIILASDFGIAALIPLNNNVFMEVGMFLGFGRPVLYLVNPTRCELKDLPFDISQEIVIEHTSEQELYTGLEREVPNFLEKVRLYSEFQYRFREKVKEKFHKLTSEERDIVKTLLLENRWISEVGVNAVFSPKSLVDFQRRLTDLCDSYGFVERRAEHYMDIPRNPRTDRWYRIHPNYREILEEIVFGQK